MRATWFDRQGPADQVLQVGTLDDPEPGPHEVRVAVTRSGINPGDLKKRGLGFGPMMFPRVVPHSDGAGVIDAVGIDVDRSRVGERVWVFGAQSYRAFGTAAEFTVVPAEFAVPLPAGVNDDLGAALGIPGITAHRAVFADGPVEGQTVLVHGVLGGVGSLAAQLAAWGGARVIGTVQRSSDLERVVSDYAVVALDDDPAAAIRSAAPGGVERIIEVALAANADLDAEVVANGAVIAAYASPAARTEIPFWPLLFQNVVIRLLGSDDFPPEAKLQAARDLTTAAAAGALTIPIAQVFPLAEIAAAHQLLETGHPAGRVLLATR